MFLVHVRYAGPVDLESLTRHAKSPTKGLPAPLTLTSLPSGVERQRAGLTAPRDAWRKRSSAATRCEQSVWLLCAPQRSQPASQVAASQASGVEAMTHATDPTNNSHPVGHPANY